MGDPGVHWDPSVCFWEHAKLPARPNDHIGHQMAHSVFSFSLSANESTIGPEMDTLFYNLQHNNSAQAATTRFKDHFKLTITHQGPPHHTLQGT